MHVRGSTQTASCAKRPMALIGSAAADPFATECTSNTHPCVFSKPSRGPTTVSSADNQVNQGVAPPAQLTVVPQRLTQLASSSRCLLTTIVVVPPAQSRSYGLAPMGGALVPFRSSWLR